MFRTSRALPTDAGQAAETEMDVVGVLGANHDDWLLHAVSARATHTRTAMPPRLRDMRQVYEPGGVWWEKLRLRRPRLVLRGDDGAGPISRRANRRAATRDNSCYGCDESHGKNACSVPQMTDKSPENRPQFEGRTFVFVPPAGCVRT